MSDIDAGKFNDELLSAYLDDELAPEERARVEERLAADPQARQLLDELRSVSRAMKELPRATLGADLRESVLRRAERAMLVTGEPASTREPSEPAWSIPFGRSKRAWFWAAAALAAGLMLMVFDRDVAKQQGMPVAVAQRKDRSLALKEALPPLEMRSLEEKVAGDEKLAHDTVASSTVAGDKIAAFESRQAEVAATPLATRSEPAVSAPASATRSDSLEFDGQGGGRAGGVGTGGVGGEMVRIKSAAAASSATAAAAAQDLVVVHVNAKPEALRGRAFDKLLVKNQIDVAEPTTEEVKNTATSNVDVVLVEAAPAQIAGCLAELDADRDQFLGITIDEAFAAKQRSQSAQDSARNLTRYNRGAYLPEQEVEVGPNNQFFFKPNRSAADRGTPEFNRNELADASEPAVQPMAANAPLAAKRSSAVRIVPQAAALGKVKIESEGTAAATDGATAGFSLKGQELDAMNGGQTKPAAPAQTTPSDQFYSEVQQNYARRALQRLAKPEDLQQVLFVFTCPQTLSEPVVDEAAQPAAAPATAAPSESPALLKAKRD